MGFFMLILISLMAVAKAIHHLGKGLNEMSQTFINIRKATALGSQPSKECKRIESDSNIQISSPSNLRSKSWWLPPVVRFASSMLAMAGLLWLAFGPFAAKPLTGFEGSLIALLVILALQGNSNT
jgi:hypothetical protein